MDKLNLFICENYAPDFQLVIDREQLGGITTKPYPCMCQDKQNHMETSALMTQALDKGTQSVILCSQHCPALQLIPANAEIQTQTSNYCFSHLASEEFLNYILGKGGYVIGSGWLTHWRDHLEAAGFTQEMAKNFYQESSKELVFFSETTTPDQESELRALSDYVGLPYVILPCNSDIIELTMTNIQQKWESDRKVAKLEAALAESTSRGADYAAIFDLLGSISSYSQHSDAIERIEAMFVSLFGAQQFRFWDSAHGEAAWPEAVADLFSNRDKSFYLSQQHNRFCIKITWQERLFGIIDVSGFLFPQYMKRYLNLALEIAKICGLAFSNQEQYEKLLESEKRLQYLSVHDTLTGLYNRAYINAIESEESLAYPVAIFMFDIDNLKEVNDCLGHAAGDKLILDVTSILRKCFRESDVVARIGGDEFVAISENTDQTRAAALIDKINNEILEHNQTKPEPSLAIGVSSGFVVSENPEDSIESLMQKADELMYADKTRKRAKNTTRHR